MRYTPDYNPRYVPSPSSTNIIVMPDLTPPRIAPVVPYTSPSTVTRVQQPSAPLNPAILLLVFGAIGVVGIAAILAFGGWDDFVKPWLDNQKAKFQKLTIVRQRVALLASAKDIQSDLIRMAERGDTDSSNGLAKILQETTLALLRHPDKVVYAWSDENKVSPDKAESLFNQFSIEERSKSSEEVLTNVSGQVSKSNFTTKDKVKDNEFILVSVLVATNGGLNLKPSDSVENLRENLVTLGSVSPDDLVALEVIWQPEGEYDVLTKEELLSLYPDLNIV